MKPTYLLKILKEAWIGLQGKSGVFLLAVQDELRDKLFRLN